MIKYKKLLIITGITFLMLFSSSLPALSSETPMSQRFGTNFSEDFALVFDLNVGLEPDQNGVSADVQVLQDLGGTVDPAFVDPVDDPASSDQQFFMTHFNSSNMNSIYLALNKIEFDLSVDVPFVGKKTLGHVNGSAPFQTLMQYFNVFDHDVFVANTFRGYLAYETTPDDPSIGPGDKVYLGYTLVEKNFINFLNGVLDANLGYTIPDYSYEQHYTNTATEKSFGMTYNNFFVVWQDVEPGSVSDVDSVGSNNLDRVIRGENIAAASVFDYLTFTYKIIETEINSTHSKIEVVTEYDVGPMSLLITRDSSAMFNGIKGLFSEVTDQNSFHNPETQYVIDFTQYVSGLQFPVTVPGLSFYTGDAVEKRIDASAVFDQGATGFGLAVASSTNVVIVGEATESTDPHQDITNAQDSVIPLSFDGNTVFETSFEGKSTYDRTRNDGSVETGLPVNITTKTPSQLSTFIDTGFSDVAKTYFGAQSLMTFGLAVLSATELNPSRFGSLGSPSDLHLTVDQSEYITLVQMPKWSGLEVTQDPSFSAVAAVPQEGETGTSSSSDIIGPGTSDDDSSSVFGFEIIALATFLPLVLRRKLKK